MRKTCWFVALAIAAVAVFAAESGPTAGSDAPMLPFDAVNDDGGGYCVTCKAGMAPLVLSFIGTDNEASRELILAINTAAETHKEQNLNAGIVIVGAADAVAPLVTWAREQEVKAPLAVMAPDSGELEKWKVNAEVDSTTIFVRQHKVHASVADLEAEAFGEKLGEIVD